MVWFAFFFAYWVLLFDVRRRGLSLQPMNVIWIFAVTGLAGSKLYHLLEQPREFLSDPIGLFFSGSGFAWFGGFLSGLVAVLWLARHYKIPRLVLFDTLSPAAALGYAIGRIGCLLSGDGDYGIATDLPWGMAFPNGLVPTVPGVRVHPTPIYEFVLFGLIAWVLWRLGARLLGKRARTGEVFAGYLILTGAARFAVELIRINPRSVFGILSNAQTVSVCSVVAGIVLLAVLRRRPETSGNL